MRSEWVGLGGCFRCSYTVVRAPCTCTSTRPVQWCRRQWDSLTHICVSQSCAFLMKQINTAGISRAKISQRLSPLGFGEEHISAVALVLAEVNAKAGTLSGAAALKPLADVLAAGLEGEDLATVFKQASTAKIPGVDIGGQSREAANLILAGHGISDSEAQARVKEACDRLFAMATRKGSSISKLEGKLLALGFTLPHLLSLTPAVEWASAKHDEVQMSKEEIAAAEVEQSTQKVAQQVADAQIDFSSSDDEDSDTDDFISNLLAKAKAKKEVEAAEEEEAAKAEIDDETDVAVIVTRLQGPILALLIGEVVKHIGSVNISATDLETLQDVWNAGAYGEATWVPYGPALFGPTLRYLVQMTRNASEAGELPAVDHPSNALEKQILSASKKIRQDREQMIHSEPVKAIESSCVASYSGWLDFASRMESRSYGSQRKKCWAMIHCGRFGVFRSAQEADVAVKVLAAAMDDAGSSRLSTPGWILLQDCVPDASPVAYRVTEPHVFQLSLTGEDFQASIDEGSPQLHEPVTKSSAAVVQYKLDFVADSKKVRIPLRTARFSPWRCLSTLIVCSLPLRVGFLICRML